MGSMLHPKKFSMFFSIKQCCSAAGTWEARVEQKDMLEQEEALMSKTDDLSKLLGPKSHHFLFFFPIESGQDIEIFSKKLDEISDVRKICIDFWDFIVAC